ncbi:hypothetical protein [Methylocystis heyeri]|uniref:Alkaline proteinase inhibitor/ Outer membrane lipoprotein Omp19 domain-containing protein n=1 Tax=Methylocystis heyeri TaxID=391905 RepID=A0A6B8K9W8_9HYPH|nr:hypothetical protein [Methylocystis heyeri]QGM44527.1 hypothetical protein H2LOC_001795 [Methylocystis heyeri]
MKQLIVLALAAAVVSAPAAAQPNKTRVARSAPSEAANYDGPWTIEATTTVGNCSALVPGSLTIQANRVASAAGLSAEPWGYVENDGTFVARFSDANGHLARANGRLSAAGGSGAWSSSTDMCGGTWRARRAGGDRASR